MMTKFFTDGFVVKRYQKAPGAWGDGEGSWVETKQVRGHMRSLKADERVDTAELLVSHRFYTKNAGIEYGDKIVKEGSTYDVKLVDNKKIPTSKLDFYQIDCEAII